MEIVFIGLAITSSWGNGHATTYRSLIKGLHRLGHRVTFLEEDQPWYADNRDAPRLAFCDTHLYRGLDDLRGRFTARVRTADAVIVGSYVRHGAEVCDWVLNEAAGLRGFYDIDTPVTLRCLETDRCKYLRAGQIGAFDLMLSFTGGPTLGKLETRYGAKRAVHLYCSVDIERYRPVRKERDLDLGYMGTYSTDRQPMLETLLNEPARRLPELNFMVVGAQYPREAIWPANVSRQDHLAPARHAEFYGRQRWTLNITREDMREAGYSPSVRLFEAAACGTPIISDEWPGIEDVLKPGEEILIATDADDVVRCLEEAGSEQARRIGRSARDRVVASHSSERRAAELVAYLHEARQPSIEALARKVASI
jgi:spore maturation protein CgeB